MNGAATVMRKDDEHKQQAKRSRRNDEEIGGNQFLDVIAQDGTHVWEGECRCRTMYFATVVSETMDYGSVSNSCSVV